MTNNKRFELSIVEEKEFAVIISDFIKVIGLSFYDDYFLSDLDPYTLKELDFYDV